MIGQTISHYRILSKLGEGGMGTVYVAEDTVLGRRVAIKSLTIPHAQGQQHFRRRFLREARAASVLNHPHIATIHDYGETEDGQPYLVMELVDGHSLCELLTRETLPLERGIEVVKQVAEAISEAHRHGIIHRDIKPSNVVINQRSEIKVLDFGLAKQFKVPGRDPDEVEDHAALSATYTLEGTIVGTPAYSSPEQVLGLNVDSRSDIFSLGSLLYECITGAPAFSGNSLVEICAQVVRDDAPPPSQLNPRIPPDLDRITLKALAKKTEDRYQTVDELLADLEALRAVPAVDERGRRRGVGLESVVARLRSSITLPAFLTSRRLMIWALILTALAAVLFAVWSPFRRDSSHEPSAEAKRLYVAGTEALRDGSYFKASALLEQAIQADAQFPLAHARLAESWMELDYEERATSEMLRVTELIPQLSSLPQLDMLYLQAITATVRRDYSGAAGRYEELVRRLPEGERTSAYFDLGRAFERDGKVNEATLAFEEAARRDEQYAAAFLRLGSLYGRRQEEAKATAAFDKAQSLYKTQSNFEGMAEVFYQKGAYFNTNDKLPAAQGQLQQAYDLAMTTDSKPQQIKILLQLGSLYYSMGETTRAAEYVNRGIELARAERLDNLTTSGLIDIGNTFFLRGEYGEAEKYFGQALQIAKANKGRRGEARASLSLGSLFVQQGNGSKALSYLEPALAFYRQVNFRRETLQALLLLGYANEAQGDDRAALEAFTQQLQLAEQVGDTAQVAHTHAAIGLLLSRQERFTEAITHFDESYRLNKSLGLELKTAYDLVNRGELLWQLGHYEEAGEALDLAFDIASRPGGIDKQLLAWIRLHKAQMALSELRQREAITESQKASSLADVQDKTHFVRASYTRGLAQLDSGMQRAGMLECQKADGMAARTGNPRLIASAQLALAEARLANGDAQGALTTALQVQEAFARLGGRHSEWRAWLIAAQASYRQHDEAKAREYASHAADLLGALERAWGAGEYRSYLSRPDVRRSRKQLDELLPGTDN